jgi:hypothetical protein
MFKKIVGFIITVLLAGVFWLVFALWTGIYSVYSVPPSHEDPDGATYIVTREEDEPVFNSPQYVAPPKKPEPESSMIRFAKAPTVKKPILERTIFQLPYIAWAYEKSLEKPDSTK